MAEIIVLPQQGNSVESCIVQTWKVAVGDTITVDQTICEVETDKATLEVPATAAGTVLALYAEEGDEVPVMKALLAVGEPGEAPPPAGDGASDAPAATTAASSSRAAASKAPVDQASAGKQRDGETVPGSAPLLATGGGGGRRPHHASPRARKLAEGLGVDTAQLAGSGPGGRVLVRDVEAAAGGSPAGAAPRTTAAVPAMGKSAPVGPAQVSEEIPVTGIRKVIAERMLASLQGSAQLTLHAPADARALLSYRARVKEAVSRTDSARPGGAIPSISINDMVNFAVARTLQDYPELNAHFLQTSIRRFAGVDLGFAVDTDKGLLVPTIQGAHGLSLVDLHHAARELAERARTGKATPADLAPATFTVTNLGGLGIEYFTPVLNVPQVAILGVGTIVYRPDASGENVPQIMLSLTIDHRAVDGAPAARFLQALAANIAGFELTLAR